jgi:hypothetical protein
MLQGSQRVRVVSREGFYSLANTSSGKVLDRVKGLVLSDVIFRTQYYQGKKQGVYVVGDKATNPETVCRELEKSGDTLVPVFFKGSQTIVRVDTGEPIHDARIVLLVDDLVLATVN